MMNRVVQQELEQEQYYGIEDEDEDEPVFVLTDEWRDFFAKSEAKRKLGKSPFFISSLLLSLYFSTPLI